MLTGAATGAMKRGPHSTNNAIRYGKKNLGRIFRVWDGMSKGSKHCLINGNLQDHQECFSSSGINAITRLSLAPRITFSRA